MAYAVAHAEATLGNAEWLAGKMAFIVVYCVVTPLFAAGVSFLRGSVAHTPTSPLTGYRFYRQTDFIPLVAALELVNWFFTGDFFVSLVADAIAPVTLLGAIVFNTLGLASFILAFLFVIGVVHGNFRAGGALAARILKLAFV